jgi:hypothetical protein
MIRCTSTRNITNTKTRRVTGWFERGRLGFRWSPLPASEKQPHGDAGQAFGLRLDLPQHRPQIWPRDRHQCRGEGLCVHSLRERRRQLRSHTRLILPRSRSGSGTPTSPLPVSTTAARASPRAWPRPRIHPGSQTLRISDLVTDSPPEGAKRPKTIG